ncbi:MAG: hypothetical protein JXA95_12230, partial [Spirochaetales bacterium]|nr:hypothetical protein [Spirochaetales bacterium]
RDDFFRYLCDNYKKVDSLGRHLNNIDKKQQEYWDSWGNKEASKKDIQSRYKFTLALENACHPGYVSEKLMHAFDADTVPIYWGDPLVDDWFNPNAFVWVKNREDFPRTLEEIRYLDGNEEAYLEKLKQPRLKISLDEIRRAEDAFIRHIFEQPLSEARRRGEGTFHDFYLRLHNEMYIRRWYRPGLIRKSQTWLCLHKLTRILGVYRLLRPLGKKIRRAFHR